MKKTIANPNFSKAQLLKQPIHLTQLKMSGDSVNVSLYNAVGQIFLQKNQNQNAADVLKQELFTEHTTGALDLKGTYTKNYSHSEQLGVLPLHELNTDVIELPSKKKKSRLFRIVQKIEQKNDHFFEDRLLCEDTKNLIGYVGYIVEIKQ